jgi:hypothetical protein
MKKNPKPNQPLTKEQKAISIVVVIFTAGLLLVPFYVLAFKYGGVVIWFYLSSLLAAWGVFYLVIKRFNSRESNSNI